MGMDRTIKRGQLGELQDSLTRLEARASSLLSDLRMQSMPAPLATVFDLDDARIQALAAEYGSVAAEGKRVRAAIDRLKDELGLD